MLSKVPSALSLTKMPCPEFPTLYMNECNPRTFTLRRVLCVAKGIFNRKASELVSDRGPVRPPGLLGSHQLWGCKRGTGTEPSQGERAGRWGEAKKGAALRREEEAEESRWSLPGAGWDPRFAPMLSQVPHLWESSAETSRWGK